MNIVTITTGAHPQNGVQVKMIDILGSQFVFSDKRGRSCSRVIDIDLAKQIIAKIQAKHYYADRMIPNTAITLSWDYLHGGLLEIRLHGAVGHIYTSTPQ
jgi:hypothetical protein